MLCLRKSDGRFSQKAETLDEARALLEEALTSGRALAKFKEMIENQGGDSSVVDQPEKLLTATYQFDLPAKETGVVQKSLPMKLALPQCCWALVGLRKKIRLILQLA